jgi:hypothetical protein
VHDVFYRYAELAGVGNLMEIVRRYFPAIMARNHADAGNAAVGMLKLAICLKWPFKHRNKVLMPPGLSPATMIGWSRI